MGYSNEKKKDFTRPNIFGLLIYITSFAQLVQRNEVNAQNSTCPGICSGNALPFPDRLIAGESCADLDLRAKNETSPTRCDAYQSVTGAACGCENPPTISCDICDGGYLWNNTAQLGPNRGQSCELIMFAAEIDNSTCDQYEPLVEEFCCTTSCSLCEDGQSPQNRDISFFGSIEGPLSSVIENPTCSQAAIVAAEWGILNSRQSDDCRFHQAIGSLYCGCSSLTQNDACTLCPDGSEPEYLNKTFVTSDGINMTCAKAAAFAAIQVNGNDKCYDWQVEGIKHCGCPVNDNQCDLCPRMDTHSNLTIPGGMTCNKAFVLASQISLDDSHCPNFQADGLNYCGCNIPEDSCTLCPDGTPSNNGFIQDANISCAEATVFATSKNRTTGECNGVNFLGLKDCGCPIPEDYCTLCPDRMFPSKPYARIPSENSNELGELCGDAHFTFPLNNREPFGSEECSNLQHRTGVLHCGCALNATKCSLCPNGQRVPDYLRNQRSPFPLSTLTCAELEAYGNLREVLSSDCQTAISTSRSFCCGINEPIPTKSTKSKSQKDTRKATKGPKSSKIPKGPKSLKQPSPTSNFTSPILTKSPKQSKAEYSKSNAPSRKSTKTPKNSKQPKVAKHYDGAAICAIQKDALPYIDEWVDYHHSIGFGKIFVYDNSREFELADWYNNRLRRPNDTDYIEIKHFPGNNQQVNAYKHCRYRISDLNSHSWIAFIDLDEFFVIQDRQKYPRIMDLLDTLPANAGALGVNWYMVGYSNQTIYEPKPVTLRYQWRQSWTNPHIKSIVRVSSDPANVYVHNAEFKDTSKFKTMDTSGAIIEAAFNENGPTDKIVIYHYATKSIEEWKARCNRGRADQLITNKTEYPPCFEGIDYLVENYGESNTIFDDTPWKILKENIPAYSKFESDFNATN